ncbi:uncharacterized membrane protein YoaK (UPF0700 family) [Azorhizobium sp. AG788]|nr:uncharacterized membrane protein YoaK (UPF0700 family) [Azorhizobium sp. AG788]
MTDMTSNISPQTTARSQAGAGKRVTPVRSDAGLDRATPRHPLTFALTLTGLAGFLDAAAYVRFDHLYVSFMSGNSTHLGMTLADGAVPDMLVILGVVGAFVAGAAAGTRIADHASSGLVPRVLVLEVALLVMALGASLASWSLICLMSVAFTMGLQNVLHQAVGGVDVGKGFVTGMLFRLGQSIARVPEGRATLASALMSLLNWLAFIAGAATGALVVRRLGFTPCLGAAVALIAVMLLMARAADRKRSGSASPVQT